MLGSGTQGGTSSINPPAGAGAAQGDLGGEGNDVGAAGNAASVAGSSSTAGTSSNGGSGSAGETSVGGTDTGGTGTGGTGAAGSGAGGLGPTGCRTGTYGGHDYEMCDVAASHAAAAADCASRGSLLARIDDAAENAWVHSSIPAADQANNNTSLWRWLGADDLAMLGEWRWADGTAFWTGGNKGMPTGGAYANWTKNQPLNPHCLAMQASDGFWYAMDCAAARPYMCESY